MKTSCDVVFVENKEEIWKYFKLCDRLIFVDYGVSVDRDTVIALSQPFPDNIRVMAVPCVCREVDWAKFKTKTLMQSNEPMSMRALKFDLKCIESREITSGVFEFVSGDPRVVAYDTKHALKYKTFLLDKLKGEGLKIGVLNRAEALCHYTYECLGNILEIPGIVLSDAKPPATD